MISQGKNLHSSNMRSQGGQRGHGPPKFLEHIVILCFERRFSKQNSDIRLKSSILPPPIFGPSQIFGLTTPLIPVRRYTNQVKSDNFLCEISRSTFLM